VNALKWEITALSLFVFIFKCLVFR